MLIPAECAACGFRSARLSSFAVPNGDGREAANSLYRRELADCTDTYSSCMRLLL